MPATWVGFGNARTRRRSARNNKRDRIKLDERGSSDLGRDAAQDDRSIVAIEIERRSRD